MDREQIVKTWIRNLSAGADNPYDVKKYKSQIKLGYKQYSIEKIQEEVEKIYNLVESDDVMCQVKYQSMGENGPYITYFPSKDRFYSIEQVVQKKMDDWPYKISPSLELVFSNGDGSLELYPHTEPEFHYEHPYDHPNPEERFTFESYLNDTASGRINIGKTNFRTGGGTTALLEFYA